MRLRAHLLAYLFYLAVAAIVTYPLAAQLSTALAGFVYGDAYEMAHHVWWFKHALQTGQNPFFQSLLAYPEGIPAITLWANPLQSFPAWLLAFALPLPAAINLQILLTLALNGWAMFWLVRYLTRAEHAVPRQNSISDAPAVIAGLIFMLYPTMQGHVGVAHLTQIPQWAIPLYVYALLRLRERSGFRRIVLAAVLFVVGAWGHTLELIYVLTPVTLVYVLWLISQRAWVALRRTLVVVLAGGLLLALFLLPVFQAAVGTEAYTSEGGAVRYSADLLGVVTPSFRHPLFGQMEYTHRVLGVNIDEGAAYIGLIAAGLALVGVWKVRESRWWLVLALVAWVLSLGPLLKIFDQPIRFVVDDYASTVTMPFAAAGSLPLVSLARAPGRFNFAVALAVAALAGYGAAYLWGRVRVHSTIKWAAALVLMAGIAFEYQTFFPLPLSPAVIPQAVADFAAREDIRAVLDLPMNNLIAAKYGMYLQTAHQHPLIAGHETRSTPVSPAKLALLQASLDPALLRSVGADAVILQREHDDGTLENRARTQLGAPTYEDAQIAIFETPPTDAVPEFAALPTTVETLTAQAESYVYAPDDGWVTFSAQLRSDAPRDVRLLLDGVTAQRWTVDGEQEISVPLPVNAGGFRTITLALDPACPERFDPALECRSIAMAGVTLDYTNTLASTPVTFDRGVTLARSYFPAAVEAGQNFPVWLWWQFPEPRSETDTRFVHITDAAGELVGQQDIQLGEIAEGETRAEAVEIALPDDLPAGEYTVSAGWYSYPEMVNFCVLVGGTCAGNAASLGTFTVE